MGHKILSCVFLANYMPKCQMSSGPHGPIFLLLSLNMVLLCFDERLQASKNSSDIHHCNTYTNDLVCMVKKSQI